MMQQQPQYTAQQGYPAAGPTMSMQQQQPGMMAQGGGSAGQQQQQLVEIEVIAEQMFFSGLMPSKLASIQSSSMSGLGTGGATSTSSSGTRGGGGTGGPNTFLAIQVIPIQNAGPQQQQILAEQYKTGRLTHQQLQQVGNNIIGWASGAETGTSVPGAGLGSQPSTQQAMEPQQATGAGGSGSGPGQPIYGRHRLMADPQSQALAFILCSSGSNEPLAVGTLRLGDLSPYNSFESAMAMDRIISMFPLPTLFEGTIAPATSTSALTSQPIAFCHVLVRRRLPMPISSLGQQQQQQQQQGMAGQAGGYSQYQQPGMIAPSTAPGFQQKAGLLPQQMTQQQQPVTGMGYQQGY